MENKFKLPLILGIIASACALLIGTVNYITEPIIAENLEKKQMKVFEEMFPLMSRFDSKEVDGIEIVNIYDDSSTLIGNVCSTKGVNSYGNIGLMVGYDISGSIVGLNYLQFSQTPGFGDKVQEPEYINQYIGDNIKSYEADAASGATYSSKLVDELVAKCSSYVEIAEVEEEDEE